MTLVALSRTLDQELAAIVRGASLECLVCGEFLLHRADAIVCLECGCGLYAEGVAEPAVPQISAAASGSGDR